MQNSNRKEKGNFVEAMEALNRMEELLAEQSQRIKNNDFKSLPDGFGAMQECQTIYENAAGNLSDDLGGGQGKVNRSPQSNGISDEQKRTLAEKLGDLKRRNDELVVELSKKIDGVKDELIAINKGIQIFQSYNNMLKYYKFHRIDRLG